MAPLGIKVTAIEPGAFRTDWAARSMQESSTPIGDYDENVGARKAMIKAFADHLPGDPRKVAEAVLMVSTLDDRHCGCYSDATCSRRSAKIADLTASIDQWESVTRDVNFPRADPPTGRDVGRRVPAGYCAIGPATSRWKS